MIGPHGTALSIWDWKTACASCLALAVMLGTFFAFGGCAGGEEGARTGGITARLVWPGEIPQTQAALALADDPSFRQAVPAGVSTLRALVFAADIGTPLQTDIAVTAGDSGSGAVNAVPAGSGRTLVVQGRARAVGKINGMTGTGASAPTSTANGADSGNWMKKSPA